MKHVSFSETVAILAAVLLKDRSRNATSQFCAPNHHFQFLPKLEMDIKSPLEASEDLWMAVETSQPSEREVGKWW